jgi:phage baseplate assembly protein W
MAFNAKKIYPIDLKPRLAIGITIPFNKPGVFGSSYQTKDAIKNNLINFFLTNTTERYLRPNFGANLRSYIFEQISNSTTDFLKEDIQRLVSTYFPSVIIDNLNILQYEDDNAIVIEMFYSIRDTGINDNLQIQFN